MARQRIRVEGRDAQTALTVAGVAGVLAATAGASPTGTSWLDPILVAFTVAAAVWAATSAPWWAGVAAAAVAAAFAPEWWLTAIAVVATLGGLWVGLVQRTLPWSRALVAAGAAQVLARLGNLEFFGSTALIAVGVMLALAVLGIRRRPRRERKMMYSVLGGTAGAVVLASAGFALAAASARSYLDDGNRSARSAISLLQGGDFEGARAAFGRASDQFGQAESALGRPWGLPAALVPVVAQHRTSGIALAEEGSEVSEVIADLLASIDYSALRLVNGAIDLEAIRSLQAPLGDLSAALDELETTVVNAKNPWLVNGVDSRLDDLLVDVSEQRERLDDATAAVTNAPAMLGGEGRRVYFVAFTTPAEARGLGGFMGNWAEVTITNGKLEFTDFGRHADLNASGDFPKTLTDMEPEYLDRYADFLLTDREAGIVGPAAWSNITASLHFPSVARTIAELYPQSGGSQVDGVFAMDVYAIAALMELTGPVEIDDAGNTIDSTSAAQFLLSDQYLEAESNEERIDMLESVAQTTIQQLLTSSLPAPPELGRLFGPLASEGRLVGWASRPEEQDVFQRVNMGGLLPDRDGGDGIAVTFNNASGSKIDYYLDGDVTYDVTVDREADTVSGIVTVTVRNTSPTSGLPDYVIGNFVGLPTGTNRTLLTVLTGLPAMRYEVDGQPGEFSVGTERGYVSSTTFLDIPPGASSVIKVFVEGSIPDDVDYRLIMSSAPTVRPFPVSVVIDGQPAGGSDDAGIRYLP